MKPCRGPVVSKTEGTTEWPKVKNSILIAKLRAKLEARDEEEIKCVERMLPYGVSVKQMQVLVLGFGARSELEGQQTAQERHDSLRKLRRYSPSSPSGTLPNLNAWSVLHVCNNSSKKEGDVFCIEPSHLTVAEEWVNQKNKYCTRTGEDAFCPCAEFNHGVSCLMTVNHPRYLIDKQSKDRPRSYI